MAIVVRMVSGDELDVRVDPIGGMMPVGAALLRSPIVGTLMREDGVAAPGLEMAVAILAS